MPSEHLSNTADVTSTSNKMSSCLAAVGCVQGVPEFAGQEQLTHLKRAMGSRRRHAKVLQVPA